MSASPEGFEVDHAELAAVAGKAKGLAEQVRASLRRDWFEDENWPEMDGLRAVVIAYRASLRAAMERISSGAEHLAEQVLATSDSYRRLDATAAQAFNRIARDER